MFDNPGQLLYDTVNRWLYVIDQGNNRVQTYNSRGESLRTWGGDGAGTLQFLEPSDIAYDQNAGWLYMVDTGTDRIQWMDVRGRFRGLKGSTGTGNE